MGWFDGGLGLTWQINVIKMLYNFFFNYRYYHKNIFWALRMWFWDGLEVVWGGLDVVWGGLGCFHGPHFLALTGECDLKNLNQSKNVSFLASESNFLIFFNNCLKLKLGNG